MIRLIFCLAVGLVAPSAASVQPAAAQAARAGGCGDPLAAMGRRPPGLVLAGCTSRPDKQGKPLLATYRVPGRHAAAIEAWLMRRAGMPRLKRSCCQWDGPPGHLLDAAGRDITVTMASPETAVRSRSRWRDIAAFEVIVATFTEAI